MNQIEKDWMEQFEWNKKHAKLTFTMTSVIFKWPKTMRMFYRKRKKGHNSDFFDLRLWNLYQNLMIKIAKGTIQMSDKEELKVAQTRIAMTGIRGDECLGRLALFWKAVFCGVTIFLEKIEEQYQKEKKVRIFERDELPGLIENNINVINEISRINRDGIMNGEFMEELTEDEELKCKQWTSSPEGRRELAS
jgi:hypothetical protein